jgi:hypothetical protein
VRAIILGLNVRLLDFLAIYGAGLSTATAVWNYFRTRREVRVLLILAAETVEGKLQHGIGISIQNPSAQTVHIAHVSLLYPLRTSTFRDKIRHLIQFRRISRSQGWCFCSLSVLGVEDRCPASIEPGKSHWIFIREEVVEGLFERAHSRRVKAVVQDPLWCNKYSRAFEYPARKNERARD